MYLAFTYPICSEMKIITYEQCVCAFLENGTCACVHVSVNVSLYVFIHVCVYA